MGYNQHLSLEAAKQADLHLDLLPSPEAESACTVAEKILTQHLSLTLPAFFVRWNPSTQDVKCLPSGFLLLGDQEYPPWLPWWTPPCAAQNRSPWNPEQSWTPMTTLIIVKQLECVHSGHATNAGLWKSLWSYVLATWLSNHHQMWMLKLSAFPNG